MLDVLYPTQLIRQMQTGKTQPSLVECERSDGSIVEVVVKCSSGTIQGTRDLAVEAVTAMLAADLHLPVPEFFAVEINTDFIELLDDPVQRSKFERSDAFAFGSLALPPGFAAWGKDQGVPTQLCPIAAEIFTFDAIVINGDRRPGNPNCLFSGTQLAIIDHELCFSHELFRRDPWVDGGFATRSRPEDHIFAKPRLGTCPTELDRFEEAWSMVDARRVDEYFEALPASWALAGPEEARIKTLVLDAKSNIAEIVKQSLGVLR